MNKETITKIDDKTIEITPPAPAPVQIKVDTLVGQLANLNKALKELQDQKTASVARFDSQIAATQKNIDKIQSRIDAAAAAGVMPTAQADVLPV